MIKKLIDLIEPFLFNFNFFIYSWVSRKSSVFTRERLIITHFRHFRHPSIWSYHIFQISTLEFVDTFNTWVFDHIKFSNFRHLSAWTYQHFRHSTVMAFSRLDILNIIFDIWVFRLFRHSNISSYHIFNILTHESLDNRICRYFRH